jgi:hypothetical protein
MPHVVSKLSVHGSVGDLAVITDFLAHEGINILAIGGGEGIFDDDEVGVIAMVLDPDDDTDLKTKLEELDLDGNGRNPTNVEMLDHVHVLLQDGIGALGGIASALAGINIRSVISMGTVLKTAHVSLGFDPNDTASAVTALNATNGVLLALHEED